MVKYKNGTISDSIYAFVIYAIAWTALVIILLPLLNVIASSFSSADAIVQGRVTVFPVDFTLRAYEAVFKNDRILRGFVNSVVIVFLGTILSIFVSVVGSYPLYRREFVGKKLVVVLMTITMFFGGGMIPTYVVMRELKLVNTIWALIIPGSLSVWNLIIMRTFFQQNIPEELREATMLDGGTDFSFLFRVVVPLSKAVIAVTALMYAVGRWNSYFDAMIYLDSAEKYPLQLVLRQILVLNQVDISKIGQMSILDMAQKQATAELLKYATIVVSSLPVMLIYPFAQKYFVKGVVVGSLKG